MAGDFEMLSVKVRVAKRNSGDTPKKATGKRGRKPRETNFIIESDFCRICKCTFRISFGNFGKEKAGYISTENIFEVPEKKGVTKRRLVDFIQQDLGLKLVETCQRELEVRY